MSHDGTTCCSSPRPSRVAGDDGERGSGRSPRRRRTSCAARRPAAWPPAPRRDSMPGPGRGVDVVRVGHRRHAGQPGPRRREPAWAPAIACGAGTAAPRGRERVPSTPPAIASGSAQRRRRGRPPRVGPTRRSPLQREQAPGGDGAQPAGGEVVEDPGQGVQRAGVPEVHAHDSPGASPPRRCAGSPPHRGR